jgi:hypothetical protein
LRDLRVKSTPGPKIGHYETETSYQAFIHELEVDDGGPPVIDATATVVDDEQIEKDRTELLRKALAKPTPEPPKRERRTSSAKLLAAADEAEQRHKKRMDENARRRKERGLG